MSEGTYQITNPTNLQHGAHSTLAVVLAQSRMAPWLVPCTLLRLRIRPFVNTPRGDVEDLVVFSETRLMKFGLYTMDCLPLMDQGRKTGLVVNDFEASSCCPDKQPWVLGPVFLLTTRRGVSKSTLPRDRRRIKGAKGRPRSISTHHYHRPDSSTRRKQLASASPSYLAIVRGTVLLSCLETLSRTVDPSREEQDFFTRRETLWRTPTPDQQSCQTRLRR